MTDSELDAKVRALRWKKNQYGGSDAIVRGQKGAVHLGILPLHPSGHAFITSYFVSGDGDRISTIKEKDIGVNPSGTLIFEEVLAICREHLG